MRSLLLVFAFLSLMNGCRSSSVGPSAFPGGRWVGTMVFRGRTIPISMDFYGNSDGWQAFVGMAGVPDDLFVPVMNVHHQHPHLNFEIQDGTQRLSFTGMITGNTFRGGAHVGEQEMVIETLITNSCLYPVQAQESLAQLKPTMDRASRLDISTP
jgi:hypothetical protein